MNMSQKYSADKGVQKKLESEFSSNKEVEKKSPDLNEVYQEDFKRQFLEEYLPLHPDLQQEFTTRNIDNVQLFTIDTGENQFLVESTLNQENLEDPTQFNYSTKSLYLVSKLQWQVIEKDLPSYCSIDRMNDVKVGPGLRYEDTEVYRRLIYEVDCYELDHVGLINLEQAKKVNFFGNNLPKWLQESISKSGEIKGKISTPLGHGPKLIFQVNVDCAGCRFPNPVVINGITGQIIDWFDYDEFSGQESNYFPGR